MRILFGKCLMSKARDKKGLALEDKLLEDEVVNDLRKLIGQMMEKLKEEMWPKGDRLEKLLGPKTLLPRMVRQAIEDIEGIEREEMSATAD